MSCSAIEGKNPILSGLYLIEQSPSYPIVRNSVDLHVGAGHLSLDCLRVLPATCRFVGVRYSYSSPRCFALVSRTCSGAHMHPCGPEQMNRTFTASANVCWAPKSPNRTALRMYESVSGKRNVASACITPFNTSLLTRAIFLNSDRDE